MLCNRNDNYFLKVIAAQGEMNAARSLKEAAEVINRSPTALQLRYLQTLNFIAAERGSTIIFPIPMDVMGGMGSNWVRAVCNPIPSVAINRMFYC